MNNYIYIFIFSFYLINYEIIIRSLRDKKTDGS